MLAGGVHGDPGDPGVRSMSFVTILSPPANYPGADCLLGFDGWPLNP